MGWDVCVRVVGKGGERLRGERQERGKEEGEEE
jgi:hypothetical protein